jgi:hypothetical protein
LRRAEFALSIVGLYPEGRLFPIGEALDKNLTIKAGNTPHRKYIPDLVELVESGVIDPVGVLTQTELLTDAIEARRSTERGGRNVEPAEPEKSRPKSVADPAHELPVLPSICKLEVNLEHRGQSPFFTGG